MKLFGGKFKMEIFVTVYIVMICLSILFVVHRLCMVEYPIIKDTTKGEDVFRLSISIGLALWTGILLYGDKI